MIRSRLALPCALLAASWPVAAQQPTLWETPIELQQVLLDGIATKGKLVFVGGSQLVNEVQGFQGQIIGAYDAKTGEQAWFEEGDVATGNVSGAQGEAFLAPLVVAKNIVVAGGGREVAGPDFEGAVRAYDAKTGTLLWSKHLASASFTEVAVVGSRVFSAAVVDGEIGAPFIELDAWDLVTGDPLWTKTHGPGAADPAVFALAAAGKYVAVVGQQNGVAPGTTDLLVRVYDAATGDFLWDDIYDAGDGNDAGFCAAIKGKLLYVGGAQTPQGGDRDTLLRAYDVATGFSPWTQSPAEAGDQVVTAMAVSGNRIVTSYLANFLDYGVRAHVAKTGQVQWNKLMGVSLNFVPANLALNGQRCIVPTDEAIFALQAKTGEPAWDAPSASIVAAIQGSRTFVAGFGSVQAYASK